MGTSWATGLCFDNMEKYSPQLQGHHPSPNTFVYWADLFGSLLSIITVHLKHCIYHVSWFPLGLQFRLSINEPLLHLRWEIRLLTTRAERIWNCHVTGGVNAKGLFLLNTEIGLAFPSIRVNSSPHNHEVTAHGTTSRPTAYQRICVKLVSH